MAVGIGRRQFISALGSASVAWPLAVHAQQPAMPVIGFLHSQSLDQFGNLVAAFRRGLGEQGYVEGKNVAIDFRWAEGQPDRLPALADQLVRRPVAVLVAGGGNLSVLAARAATPTIPIVFPGADDPVKLGVVASFNRPGGNATGVSLFNSVLAAKRFDLLHALLPKAEVVAVLVNPKNPNTVGQLKDIEEAAQNRNQTVQVLNASSEGEIDTSFAALKEKRADALIIGADPFFQSNRDQLLKLAARLSLPTIYFQREFPASGGLISYGIHFPDAYRQAGVYTARILKGEKPADLPVVQMTRFELVINLKTAKALGLDVPPTLLALADEVIE
jgi:putative ABC transport system substrate-binding protein